MFIILNLKKNIYSFLYVSNFLKMATNDAPFDIYDLFI